MYSISAQTKGRREKERERKRRESVVYSIVWLHSYSCPDLLGFCARMRSTCSLPYSCLFPFFSPSLSSCNCKCTRHFLRLVCPCLCHEHTQYWRRGLVNFHASLCKTVTRTLNFLQIRRREGWPRSGLLSRMTPALETGKLTRNDVSRRKCCG